jgi:hypothetical protein
VVRAHTVADELLMTAEKDTILRSHTRCIMIRTVAVTAIHLRLPRIHLRFLS